MTDDVLCDTVPLARVAFIHAGLADGLSLDELLEHQDLDVATWGRAQQAFSRLFARGAREGDAFALEVDALSDLARTGWERKLPPLDEEVGAFLDFERHYAASVDGLAFLSERRMRPSDLTRLERLWNDRFAVDPGQRAQALARLAEEPGPCPEVRPAPPRLVAPPAPRTRAEVAAGANLPLPFLDGEANLAPPPLSTPLPTVKKSGLDGTRDIGDLQAILASLPFARSAAPSAPVAPAAVAPAVIAIAIAIEIPAVVARAAPEPPPPPPAPPLVAPEAPALAPAPKKAVDLRGTSLAVDAPSRAALPFGQGSSGARPKDESPPTSIARGEPARLKAPSDLRETSAVFFAPQSHAMPFSTRAPAAPPPAETSGLTVEQYASLCVDFAGEPARAAETLRRYHLSPEQKRALDADWHARFAREPSAWLAWDRACKTYKAWLDGQKGQAT
ncbi:MAG: hypothetical protein ABJE95_11080 [Byssovorax sp.]